MSSQSIDYQSVLADLKARRDRLNMAISAVEQILGELSQPVPPSAAREQSRLIPAVSNDTSIYKRMTIKDAAIDVLQRANRPLPTGDISRTLKGGGIPSKSQNLTRTVYNILSQEAGKDDGGIVRVDGLWDLRSRQQSQERSSKQALAQSSG